MTRLKITIILFVWVIFYWFAINPIIINYLPSNTDLTLVPSQSDGSFINSNYLSNSNQHSVINLPDSLYSIKTEYSYKGVSDARIIALKKYLEYRGSPIAPYAELIVKEADKNDLDWRILVAISGVESNFCLLTPYQSYNCWGWRGGPGGDFSKFGSWKNALIYMSKRFRTGYGKNPNPYAIEATYCPPCGATGVHAWAQGVTRFRNEIQHFYNEIVKADPTLRKAVGRKN